MELEEGRWLYHDNGAHRREGMLTRTCPRCGREDRMPHGGLRDHGDHTTVLYGEIIHVKDLTPAA